MKILFLHKQILFPRDTGGKIRVLNLLKFLAKWHEVTYVSNLRSGEEQFLSEMKGLGLHLELVPGNTSKRGGFKFYASIVANFFSPNPFTIDRNFDPKVREKISQLLGRNQFDLIICDTIVMARHTIGTAKTKSILFQHNVEAQILRRHADISKGRLKKWFMSLQWARMVRFEKSCGEHFNAVVAVSEQDKYLFEKEYGWDHVFAIDTAVDEDYFRPTTSSQKPDRVMFLGSMDWMPNQDGVRWFVSEIWPKILQAHPKATFHIVGRNPPAEIRSLGSAPGVSVLGSVPDVRPHLSEASVVVVPLLVGGGTRLKIYEAMAMSRAVVSTGIGAEGLPVVPEKHFLKADDSNSFAEAVNRLLASEETRQSLGETADRFVRENYGSEAVARQFERICFNVVGGTGTV